MLSTNGSWVGSDSLKNFSRTKCWGNSDLSITAKHKFYFANARIDVNVVLWDVECWLDISSTEIFKLLLWHHVILCLTRKYKTGNKTRHRSLALSDEYLYKIKLYLKTHLHC